MLGDIKNKPENQRYSNIQEYFKILESTSVSNDNHFPNTTVVQRKSKYQYIQVNQNHQGVPRLLLHHPQNPPVIVPIQNPVINRPKHKRT